ncbi:ATP-binding cassette domain-containing protein [Paracoccus saliphilus]|uniref:ABC transporter ATP-binding protein n=1 Tax=Paracoccus saliphilus TaxID=405559 RepID=A0ABY7SA63_9RHOB|nr:ABC transporter ATP-binding protein [Paracoccus saliphilus]WCR02992.1 ABC transporter ATP-binding protein [Paracoccus saliphilus]
MTPSATSFKDCRNIAFGIPELHQIRVRPTYASRFPHELSGGQRVAIARVLVERPAVVVADEPVSALDVTVQAQILTLLQQLRERFGFSCLFIDQELGVVEPLCDRVLVMYQGRIMEQAPTSRLFEQPITPILAD